VPLAAPSPDDTDPAGRSSAAQGRVGAILLARKHFINSRRVEMGPLAQELGVSRMTVNRWVGSRDQLLGEVNWTLAHTALENSRLRAAGSGAEVVADTVEGFIRTVLEAPFMRYFLQQEGEIALRVLTTRSSDLQHNFISYVAALLRDEVPASVAGMPIDDLAYLVVRIAESFCYVDLITGDAPDASKVGVAVRALLS